MQTFFASMPQFFFFFLDNSDLNTAILTEKHHPSTASLSPPELDPNVPILNNANTEGKEENTEAEMMKASDFSSPECRIIEEKLYAACLLMWKILLLHLANTFNDIPCI